MAALVVKRGDSFIRTCTRTEDGAAVSVTNYTIRCQLRDIAESYSFDFTVTKLTQSGATLGMFTISALYTETEDWPVGQLKFDIEFTDLASIRQSTSTVLLTVNEDITR